MFFFMAGILINRPGPGINVTIARISCLRLHFALNILWDKWASKENASYRE